MTNAGGPDEMWILQFSSYDGTYSEAVALSPETLMALHPEIDWKKTASGWEDAKSNLGNSHAEVEPIKCVPPTECPRKETMAEE